MSWTEIALRLGVAALIGTAIGLDHELRPKSAGVHTIGLMSLAGAVATLANMG